MNKYNASAYIITSDKLTCSSISYQQIHLKSYFSISFQVNIIINYILNKLVFLKPTNTSSLYIPDNGCRFDEFSKKSRGTYELKCIISQEVPAIYIHHTLKVLM